MSDLPSLGDFLQRRREALQPEDVGLARGVRRRTAGLRREEVALLSHMSTDYYARLERGTGPTPSEQMLTSLAQGMHLSLAERDHLFRLAGHQPPSRQSGAEHVSPGMLRVLDRLDDTPAEIVTELGETLRQSRLGIALLGDAALRSGPARSVGYRWFTDAAARAAYPPAEIAVLSRLYAAGLRELVAARGPRSRAAELADDLRVRSTEFAALWDAHEVGARPPEVKRFHHPEVGHLDLSCQTLLDPDHSHRLLVYTAQPGSESAEKLRLLAVIGSSSVAPR